MGVITGSIRPDWKYGDILVNKDFEMIIMFVCWRNQSSFASMNLENMGHQKAGEIVESRGSVNWVMRERAER